jgi:hypothetical protein
MMVMVWRGYGYVGLLTRIYSVRENYEDDVPQGWLARDHDAWVRSHQMIKGLQRRTNAKVVLGHCWDTVKALGLEFAPKVYE